MPMYVCTASTRVAVGEHTPGRKYLAYPSIMDAVGHLFTLGNGNPLAARNVPIPVGRAIVS
jgi:hypothetical protein